MESLETSAVGFNRARKGRSMPEGNEQPYRPNLNSSSRLGFGFVHITTNKQVREPVQLFIYFCCNQPPQLSNNNGKETADEEHIEMKARKGFQSRSNFYNRLKILAEGGSDGLFRFVS